MQIWSFFKKFFLNESKNVPTPDDIVCIFHVFSFGLALKLPISDVPMSLKKKLVFRADTQLGTTFFFFFFVEFVSFRHMQSERMFINIYIDILIFFIFVLRPVPWVVVFSCRDDGSFPLFTPHYKKKKKRLKTSDAHWNSGCYATAAQWKGLHPFLPLPPPSWQVQAFFLLTRCT